MIPGPNVALIVSTSIAHGRGHGLVTVAGTSSAMVLQLALAIAGLTAMLTMSADLFAWLRWAGVFYLCYLAFRAWFAPARFEYKDSGDEIADCGLSAWVSRLPHQSQDVAVLWGVPAAICEPNRAVAAAASDIVGILPRARDCVRRDMGRSRWAARFGPGREGAAAPSARGRSPAGSGLGSGSGTQDLIQRAC